MHALPNVPGDLFMFEELSTGEFTGDGQGCHEEAERDTPQRFVALLNWAELKK